jgi:Protein of unknown function (DUF1194)
MLPTIRLLASVAISLAANVAHAEAPLTDANLITAIDVSESIDAQDEALQFEGIAAAIVDPAFLKTVAAGYLHRVGFTAFAWSSHGHFVTLVPWTMIDSPASAARVAAQLRSVHAPPRRFPPHSPGKEPRPWRRYLLTDVSGAIEHAARVLARAPFATGREVVNILANGIDNVGEGPERARAWAIRHGVLINGLVIGGDDEVVAYFRERVQCGAGSFVLATHEPSDIAWAMLQKFLLDLAADASDVQG